METTDEVPQLVATKKKAKQGQEKQSHQSVPANIVPKLVPAIIVENGTVEASFDVHKDTTKVLAETRLATTFTLGKFDTTFSVCYGVTNGGSKMSVMRMEAILSKSGRSYTAVFCQSRSQESKKSFTLEYSFENYKEIMLLFVSIFMDTRTLQQLRPRESTVSWSTEKNTPQKIQGDFDVLKPGKGKESKEQQNPKSNTNSRSASNHGTNYSGTKPKTNTIDLNGVPYSFVVLTENTRVLKHGNNQYFAKVGYMYCAFLIIS